MELEALDHVGLVVSDMTRSIRWHQEVLGLRRAHQEAWGEFPAVLEANGSGVTLFLNDGGGPVPADDLPDPDGYQVEITTYEPAPA